MHTRHCFRGGNLNEYYLIDHILQNQPPTVVLIDELVEKSFKKFEGNPWNDLCFFYLDLDHARLTDISPSKTLNINPSLSVEKEDKLCIVLRQHLDAFSWEYKEMKGVHHSVCTQNI